MKKSISIFKFREELQNSPYKDGNEKQPFLSNDSCEVGSREHFYKSQLQERESIIQDLKISLEVKIIKF